VFIPLTVFVVGFPTASPVSAQLVKWLREQPSDGGRVFFYIPDHGAHNTPLGGQLPFYQVMSQRSLIGVPGGALPKWSIEWIQEIGDCLKDSEIAESCRDLYNIHHVVILDSNTTGAALPNGGGGPSNFRLVRTIDRIQIYEARQSSTYFLEGQGEVQQQLNRITITAEPAESLVLKFFWVPGLRTIPPLPLEPYPLANGNAFIKVTTDFHRRFDIVYQ
jgi:hypothetical protein